MTAAVVDWRLEQRRNALRALLLSILLHLLLILGIAFALTFQPVMETVPPEEETLEMVFVDPPAPRDETTPYLATTDAQRSEAAPESPAFESDKDTRAASEAPAAGDAPLPTQAGEESPATAFENREYTPGDEPRPSSPPVPESRPAPPAEQPPAEPLPTPRVPASEIALLQPLRPRETPRPTPQEKPAEPPSPEAAPRLPAPPGFQPQTRITRLKGNISNRGRAAADATATPLGRYKKQISDAIGSRWYYYVNDAIGLLNVGTVEIRFAVMSDGTIKRVEVLRNSSNESFASTSVRAVADAEIPPIPPELLPMLQDEQIEVDFTFTILGN
jgi:TonB family protein